MLDMGESVKIIDLAHRMIELSGLSLKTDDNPAGDISIEVTGLRPGEKLYEELLIGDDPKPTVHPRIMKAHEAFMSWEELSQLLAKLNQAVNGNEIDAVRDILQIAVPGYKPDSQVADWIYRHKNPESNHL